MSAIKKTSILFFLFISSCTFEKAPVAELKIKCTSTSTIHYSTTIAPIIVTSCSSVYFSGCHEAGSANGNYTVYEVLKLKVDNGSLYNRIVKLRTMPPDTVLSDSTINLINCWIQQGGQN